MHASKEFFVPDCVGDDDDVADSGVYENLRVSSNSVGHSCHSHKAAQREHCSPNPDLFRLDALAAGMIEFLFGAVRGRPD